MEYILALDMATCTGWAFDGDQKIEWGHFDVREHAGLGPKLYAFRSHLQELLIEYSPDVIWIERPCGHSGAAINLARGMQAILLVEAVVRSLPVHDVAPNTLKKFTTGNGRCGKNQMLERAYLLTGGTSPLTFDEADAICLLKYAQKWDADEQ